MAVLLTACAVYQPPYYSLNNLTLDEVEQLFDVDSSVSDMKYFNACLEEFEILPVPNWQSIDEEGVVGLSIQVDKSGTLEAAMIIQSVHPALDSAAMNSVKNAKYISSDRIINVDNGYVIQMLIPYYNSEFDVQELSIINAHAYDEMMYDIAPIPEKGWEDETLRVKYEGYANMQAVEGETQITFCIDSKGKPGQFYVAKPFGYGAEEQAINAIRNVTWIPAQKAGRAVPCMINLPFQFYYWY